MAAPLGAKPSYETLVSTIVEMGNSQDVYGLLALDVPTELTEKVSTVYKARGYIVGRYNLVKLTGEDFRKLSEANEAEIEGKTTPHRWDGSNFFKVTELAARYLCQYIRENKVDSLMLHSLKTIEEDEAEEMTEEEAETRLKSHVANQQVLDPAIEVLAENLPEKMVLLHLVGNFGNKGLQALEKNLERLSKGVEKLDPTDYQIGALVADSNATTSYRETFERVMRARPEGSTVSKADCLVM
jgi:hypothetical protein